jgi:hypothetical protein
MPTHRYILMPYKGRSSRSKCPQCNKDHEFAPYIDTEDNNNIVADHVGRCNREESCGYHFTPKQYFDETGNSPIQTEIKEPVVQQPAPKPINFHPHSYLQVSVKASLMQHNNLFKYLAALFTEKIALDLSTAYLLGSSKHWPGASIFWQIDRNENVRAGKVMLYDPETGRRVKEPFNHITWVHSVLKLQEFNYKQCFFGEHLLTEYPCSDVAIVESEKTAMIASIYLPQFIWIATGGKNGCRWNEYDVFQVLKDRNVILFPDLNAFDKWQERANNIKSRMKVNIYVSDLLEKVATDEQKAKGLDLADFLVKQDSTGLAVSENDYPAIWDYKLKTVGQ